MLAPCLPTVPSQQDLLSREAAEAMVPTEQNGVGVGGAKDQTGIRSHGAAYLPLRARGEVSEFDSI